MCCILRTTRTSNDDTYVHNSIHRYVGMYHRYERPTFICMIHRYVDMYHMYDDAHGGVLVAFLKR
jgi:hypothetical protein